VQNFWYYLLSTGKIGTNDKGNAYNVVGIGRAKATAIAFRNLTVYLTSSSKYTDARFYAIQAATDLYGGCSQEVSSTANAWYAVGVGTIYTAKVTAQFSAGNTVGCNVPFTVNFTNQSANGNTYIWYFGDGTTSTATNPSHTYTTLGNYSVKLVASGGSCGNDSITKTNLINLSVSNPCSVVLPPSGSAQTQVSCNGILYDDGGQYGLYSNYVNSTVTIAPTNASKVTLTFTKFRLEAGYDFLYVYDGPSTASPLLGAYTGLTLPASVSSSVSSITVKFVSDPAAVDSGFAINWQCTLANAAPVANFFSSTSNTCTGEVLVDLLLGYGILEMALLLLCKVHFTIISVMVFTM
jgi:PKD repeat protein